MATFTEDEDLVERIDELMERAAVPVRLSELEAFRNRIARLEVELGATRRELAAEHAIASRARAAVRDLAQLDETRGKRVMVHGVTIARMIVEGSS